MAQTVSKAAIHISLAKLVIYTVLGHSSVEYLSRKFSEADVGHDFPHGRNAALENLFVTGHSYSLASFGQSEKSDRTLWMLSPVKTQSNRKYGHTYENRIKKQCSKEQK